MPGPTNLTDRISHLRDRKGSSPVVQGGQAGAVANEARQSKVRKPERAFATDYFMLFVYALLVIAFATQLLLIVWLDLV